MMVFGETEGKGIRQDEKNMRLWVETGVSKVKGVFGAQ